MSNWVVRKATLADARWIVGQARAFQEFFGPELKFNEEHMSQLVTNLILNQTMLVAEKDNQLGGFVAAMVHPHVFNPDLKVFTELAWWVAPECRNTRAGIMLLNALEDQRERIAPDLTVMSTEMHSPVSERALTKRGYRPQEIAWIK